LEEYGATALPQSLSAVTSASMESIISAESNPKGVLSAASSQNSVAIIMPISASINLDELTSSNNYPDTTRQVYITSCSTPIIHVCKLNPIKVATEIDKLCGEVNKVEYKPSGSLLVTTQTLEQVRSLLATTTFCNIPVQVTIAWTSQTSQGEIYAPEFLGDSIDDLLQILRPSGVVGIRKLYQDPKKCNSPLYVLKFLTAVRPAKLRVGYCQYNVDPYYSSPVRCNKCFIWGHPSKYCKSPPSCMRCGSRTHTGVNCGAELPTCSNCKGPHLSTHKQCPAYEIEKAICQYSAQHGVSFKEARILVKGNNTRPETNQQLRPNVQSILAFPSLTQQQPAVATATQPARPGLSHQHHIPTQPAASQDDTYALKARSQPTQASQYEQQSQESAWLTQGQRNQNAPQQVTYFQSQESVQQNQSQQRRNQSQQETQSEEPDWLTPGQPSRNTQQRPPSNHDNLNLSLEPPPPQSYNKFAFSNSISTSPLPSHQPEPYYDNNRVTANLQTTATKDVIFAELKQNLMPLMSPIMKLFFATTTTEKVDSFLEIGTILNSVGIVNDLLLKLGLSSLSSSQQH
jgi:hypothetical protein